MKKTALTFAKSFVITMTAALFLVGCSEEKEVAPEKEIEEKVEVDEGALDLDLEAMFPDETSREFVESVINKKAGDFELKNLDGETVSLSDFKGKPVIIEFALATCSACQDMQPNVDEFKESSDVPVVQIFNTGDTKKTIEEFIETTETEKHDYMLIGNNDLELAEAYKVKYVPSFYFVDHEGMIRFATVGVLGTETLKSFETIAFEKVPAETVAE